VSFGNIAAIMAACRMPLASRRGWVAQASDDGNDDTPPSLAFRQLPDGCWVLSLATPEDVKSAKDMVLDVSETALSVSFPGRPAFFVALPPCHDATRGPECSCQFSKSRRELLVTVAASSHPHSSLRSHAEISPTNPGSLAGRALTNPQALTEVSAPPCPPAENVPLSQEEVARQVDRFTQQLYERKAASNRTKKPSDTPRTGAIDPDAETIASILMLHSAAATQNLVLVRRLLDAGVSADAEDELGATALEKACMAGSVEVASLLLDHGASSSGVPGAPSTPLHRAAISGGDHGHEIVRLLLRRGANRFARDRRGRTAAEAARDAGQVPPQELG